MHSHFIDTANRRRMMTAAAGVVVTFVVPVRGQTIDTSIGELEFEAGYPTEATVEKLYDELDAQRAVQAYLWAPPMASNGAMADESIRLGCDSSTVLIADGLAQPYQLALTANQDTRT